MCKARMKQETRIQQQEKKYTYSKYNWGSMHTASITKKARIQQEERKKPAYSNNNTGSTFTVRKTDGTHTSRIKLEVRIQQE